jgi:hypothetical protein
MTHYWRVRKWLPERYGQACAVVVAGRGPGPRNVRVRFADGFETITSRWNVRRIP